MSSVTKQKIDSPTPLRNTFQRSMVLEAVQHLHNHPSSEEIFKYVNSSYPEISRATVYRNLRVLAHEGKILQVDVPGGAARYDFRCDDHYHAQCRVCGKVFDIEMPYFNDIQSLITNNHGFTVENHDIVFSGVCAECKKKAEEKN
ncbi:MAG: Fur family transcriptional regulator [Eggerthellaceae bacterium]|jgi:Fe2+ or Zn2+ uptake regulation protein